MPKIEKIEAKSKNDKRVAMNKSTRKKLFKFVANFIKKPSYMLLLAIGALIFWEYYAQDMGMKESIKDTARVVDGDTIAIDTYTGVRKIRLKDMDAPELSQKCSYGDNQQIKYRCGEEAALHLRKMINSKSIECTNEGNDIYGRQLAYCYADGTNINCKMVLDGWAVSYNNKFIPEELIAKTANRGIWRGDFTMPKDYRKQHKQRS